MMNLFHSVFLDAEPSEKQPLAAEAAAIDVAVIWVEKAQSGSTRWVDTCSLSQLSAYRLKQQLDPVHTAVKWALLLSGVLNMPSYCVRDTSLCPGSPYANSIGLRSSSLVFVEPRVMSSVCLALWSYLLFHIILKRHAFGEAYVVTWTRILGCLLVVVAIVDNAFAVVNGIGLPVFSTFSLSGLFRPVAFLLFTKPLREAAGRLLRAIPGFADALLSLLLCILFFAWTGLVVFRGTPEGKEQFNGWQGAIANLWVLFTTANNPGVWLPAYAAQKLAFLFFFMFLVISLFLLSNVLLAAVYDSYKDELKTMIKSFYTNRRTCFRHAFNLLADDDGSISQERWVEFFPRLCSALDMDHIGQHKSRALAVFNALDVDGEKGLDEQEFSAILQVMQNTDMYVPQTLPSRRTDDSGITRFFRHLTANGIHIGEKKVMSWASFVDCFLFVNVCAVLAQTHYLMDGSTTTLAHSKTHFVLFGLTLFYAAITTLKMHLRGLTAFWRSEPVQNRFDFFNAFPSLILECVSMVDISLSQRAGHPPSGWLLKTVVLLHIMRTFRLIKHVRPLRYIANFVVQLAPTYYRMGMLLLLLYYVYTLLGVHFFGGLIYPTNPALQGMPFAASEFWDINFNDFPSGMVTLFCIMLIAQWNNITIAFMRASGNNWAAAFFTSFWILTNLIVLNILMALILECSSTLRGEIDVEDDEAPTAALTYEDTLRKVLLGERDDEDSPSRGPRSASALGDSPRRHGSSGYGAVDDVWESSTEKA
mmetsp:Transcript_93240/g.240975  ORF Transcript_93240/g.240975 Transcript_93240/m.240975 type:complete len:760 (-) Transcript_93240:232-2511(-)